MHKENLISFVKVSRFKRVSVGPMNEPGQPRPAATGHGPGPAWSELPNYTVWDLVTVMWRERWWALGAAAAITLIGLVLVLQIPKTFVASAKVLVLFDEAYVLNPVREVNQPAAFSSEQIVQSEVAFLQADKVKRDMLAAVGMDTAFPKLARALEDRSPEYREAEAVRGVDRAFGVSVAPQSPTIALYYRDTDPERSALVLNTLIDAYLEHRRAVLLTYDPIGSSEEREAAESRLEELNTQLAALLSENAIGDFVSDREAARTRSGQIETDLFATQAERAEAEARLAALNGQVAVAPVQVDLYTDDGAAARLQQLQVEREELLTRYLPTSQAVQDIDRRIARLQQSAQSGSMAAGLTRRGPNPLRQQLESERASVAAQVAALRSKETTLRAQLEAVRDRQLGLQALAPEFQRLDRERSALEISLDRLIERDELARARQAINLRRQSENIRIVERARPPVRGSSLRRPAFMGVVLLAGFTGLVVALTRGLWRRIAPTPNVAARTLGVDVLAVVPPHAGRA